MSWRLAQSLVILRDQIDAMYPDRDKRTDGAISGYPGAISGHNVNAAGVVCAMDITTGDYPGGITMAQSYPLADAIRNELLVAPRGLYTYIIHHMEPPYVPTPGPYIAHGGPASLWQWIPYPGIDPHTSHIHISVDEDIPTGGTGSGEDPYDMTDPWNLGGVSTQSGTITPIQEELVPNQSDKVFDAIDGSTVSLNELLNSIDRKATAAVSTAQQALAAVQGIWSVQATDPTDPKKSYRAIDYVVSAATRGRTNAEAIARIPTATPTAPPLDVQALAAELAPLLTTNQAHQFIVALGQALPKE